MLQIESLNKSFGDRQIFSSVSFALDRGAKVGLIAPNGTGKTTLMNILVGKEPYDSGSVTYENGVRWSYLPQNQELPQEGTILEACFNPFDEVARLVLSWKQALSRDDQEEMARLLPEMEAKDGWQYEQRAKEILGALGINDVDREVKHASGGEAKRISLAAALIDQPDLLFLDEPTNHLDVESIEWLEGYLSRASISLVLVTHDRYFLDRVCNEILEIDAGQLYRYKGNYAYYLEKKRAREEAEQASLSRNSNILRRELEWMRRQPQARGGKARYRIEAYHKLAEETKRHRQERTISLHKGEGVHLGKKIFEAKGVRKAFGDKMILMGFDYTFTRGDKVGIVGANGVGKTTFLRMLLGQEPTDEGTFDIGETVRFGYYGQLLPDFDPSKRVIDIVTDIAERFDQEHKGRLQALSASQLLTQFLFEPERQYSPISKLSGGEIRRLYLCTVLVSNPNFLILDEPTNDLDILTLSALEEYLVTFVGCVLIVSHDRFFMDKVVEHLLCFEGDGVVRDFPGNYSHYRAYLESKKEEGKIEEKKQVKQNREEPPARRQDRPVKLSFAEKRELEQLGIDLQTLEEEKGDLEAKMSSGLMDATSLLEASLRIQTIIEELDEKTLRLLELEDKQR